MNEGRKNIDWNERKKLFLGWRNELNRLTRELMTSSGRIQLSDYNDDGYYHHVQSQKHFDDMKSCYEKNGNVPQSWFYKGRFPGIWISMFDPCNTYTIAYEPLHFVRLYFKDDFSIFDKENTAHKRRWKDWGGWRIDNMWSRQRNGEGVSMESRMRGQGVPSHKWFYEANRFGAFLGYNDYISPVAVLEDSIEKVEFI